MKTYSYLSSVSIKYSTMDEYNYHTINNTVKIQKAKFVDILCTFGDLPWWVIYCYF